MKEPNLDTCNHTNCAEFQKPREMLAGKELHLNANAVVTFLIIQE
jgi:hypothetical protein